MADYEHILFDVAEGAATITLNRPEKLNAYITPMGDAVTDAFRSVRDDASVRWTRLLRRCRSRASEGS